MADDLGYTLTSDRLGFRMLEENDFENLVKLDMDPEVRAFFPGGVSTPELLREKIIRSRTCFLEKGFGEFSITELNSNKFLGRAGFAELDNGEIEVGYLFLKEYWGQGLATETLRALLDWAGSMLSAPHILAYAPVDHHASIRVMKKAGMRYLKTETQTGAKFTYYEYPLKPRNVNNSDDMNAHILKLSYPCIFSKSPEEAANNLYRQISRNEGGFDEGSSRWKSIIEQLLVNKLDIQALNSHGTEFSEEWWKNTLSLVLAKLSASDPDTYELNDGHILEATDRLHVACVYLDEILGQHPLLNSVPEFKGEVDKAIDLLASLYQKLGQFDSVQEIADTCELADVNKVRN